MKCIYIVALCLILINGESIIEVEDTNVKDPTFEQDAIESYKQAHDMVPTENELFYQTLSLLFGSKRNESDSWKISTNCAGFFNPNKTSPYIVLYVNYTTSARHIRIFA
ncbi:uncharacterized protein LOC130891196 [Diorhabda carinulata]|uniref:uncharacterized protein LOC130444151 n=1 Tax=Diorhabda sublineata TaxID=1163346 RepID=UPI0024E08D80|nr:uncharacterized protein LOC130444151 [Diorhabda sublineata]XP_057651780.1 uncharacterized protein LOC130891196 [Diorhabda carinulata]